MPAHLTMAPTTATTGLERKLERFFSRRKAHNSTTTPPPSSTESTPGEHSFPSPSFIRPKNTRMMARDEVLPPPSPARRTQSVPEAPFFTKNPAKGHNKTLSTSTSSSCASAHTYPCPPTRSSSLCHQTREATLATLTERQTQSPAVPSSERHRWTSSSLASTVTSSSFSARRTSRTSRLSFASTSNGLAHTTQRLDTPPPSDDEGEYSHTKRTPTKVLVVSKGAPPTPATSPEISPPPPKTPHTSAESEFLETGRYSRYVDPAGEPRTPKNKMALRKALSTSSLTPTRRGNMAEILDEPTFGDFLALSDDDIAESRPESPLLPEDGSPSSCNNKERLPAAPALMRTPSGLRRTHSKKLGAHKSPAAAAAFEAARIASRYNFDLVYVVSLWPKGKDESSPPPSSPSSRHSSRDSTMLNSEAIINQNSGMNGRLMAAYGLGLIKSPFKISTAVHQKILRNEGWIEYRNPDAAPDEFARGYACSFYAGHGSDLRRGSGSSAGSSTSDSSASSDMNNRGIVFAAYRRPREGAAVGCGGQELGYLHSDAQKLVDMLISTQASSPVTPKPKTYSPFPPTDRTQRMSSLVGRKASTAKAAVTGRTRLSPTPEVNL